MRSMKEVLTDKGLQLLRLRKEVDALRIVAALLSEKGDIPAECRQAISGTDVLLE